MVGRIAYPLGIQIGRATITIAFVKTVGLMHALGAKAARSVYTSANSDIIGACTFVVSALDIKRIAAFVIKQRRVTLYKKKS